MITNEKGRLSQEEIDRMIKVAEEFAEADKEVKEKVDAKNSLDSLIYSVKNSVEDPEKFGKKIDESDKTTVLEAVKTAEEWLKEN